MFTTEFLNVVTTCVLLTQLIDTFHLTLTINNSYCRKGVNGFLFLMKVNCAFSNAINKLSFIHTNSCTFSYNHVLVF
jgi:hypothetical protein